MTAIEIIALIALLISLVMLILSFVISKLFNDDLLFLFLVFVISFCYGAFSICFILLISYCDFNRG